LMDLPSLRSVVGKPGVPDIVRTLPDGAAALLVDYQADTAAGLATELEAARRIIAGFTLIASEPFTTSPQARQELWTVRDGIFSSVGGARAPGTTVILEDVAVAPAKLADLVQGEQALFAKYGYDGAIFGHAKAGNTHFLVTDDMSDPARVGHFGEFMEEVIALVLRLDGSLKAEHGTGRAVAPFVEAEWGSEAYAIMKAVKSLLDPLGILNPGVLINDDPHVHLAHVKSMDVIGDAAVDRCIECGFCEHVCPTRAVTLTPRHRIVTHRVRLALEAAHEDARAASLAHEYAYEGRDTCVTDGMCSTVCPMGINTAALTDHDRSVDTPKSLHVVMRAAAKEYHLVEDAMRLALDAGVTVDEVAGGRAMPWVTRAAAHLFPGFPQWSAGIGKAPDRPHTAPDHAEVVYFPSCVSRITGSSQLGKDSVMTTVLRVAERAGVVVHLPKESIGLCCSQIWEHTGFTEGQALMANRMVEAMWEWSKQGSLPIMCDVTSCTRTLLTELETTSFGDRAPLLNAENLERYRKLQIIDLAAWLHDSVLPELEVKEQKGTVVLHPTCACHELGLNPTLEAIGAVCAAEVVIPTSAGCCGAGGDRGFLHPEVPAAALHDEAAELAGRDADGAYSLAKTCEIVLSDHLPYDYESIIYLVDETTEAKAATT